MGLEETGDVEHDDNGDKDGKDSYRQSLFCVYANHRLFMLRRIE